MSIYKLPFGGKLSKVAASRGQLTVEVAPECEAVPAIDPNEEAIATLTVLTERIDRLENDYRRKLENLTLQVGKIAIEVASTVLGGDEELVHRRVEEYVKTALKEAQPEMVTAVHVHSSCITAISNWLDKGGYSMTLCIDDTLAPGDCRVESGECGLLATLEDHLFAIGERMAREGVR